MRWLRIATLAVAFAGPGHAAETLRDGDIIFHTSRSSQSLAIQRATHSPWSHVGVVFFRDGQPYVYEAIATVRYTPLETWTARGDGGRYVVKRLRRPVDATQVAKLRAAAKSFAGKPYDLYFEWSNRRIYCSELVWKLYHDALGVDVGELQKLREFDLTDPAVRARMKERYGDKVPLDEPVISPAGLFASPLLVEVKLPG
jgi:uncharacterized protein YycO